MVKYKTNLFIWVKMFDERRQLAFRIICMLNYCKDFYFVKKIPFSGFGLVKNLLFFWF